MRGRVREAGEAPGADQGLGWVGGQCWKPSQGSCFLLPVPGSLREKESDWIVSISLEGSAGASWEMADWGSNQGRLPGRGGAEPSGPGQRGRGDRWRPSGRWGGERHGRSLAGGLNGRWCGRRAYAGKKEEVASQVWGLGVGGPPRQALRHGPSAALGKALSASGAPRQVSQHQAK